MWNAEKNELGLGTFLVMERPWGMFRGARVLCSDGRLRNVARISLTADTFFSVPAAVRVKGRTVSGFVTIESASGEGTEGEGNPRVAKFVRYDGGYNADALPDGAYKGLEVKGPEPRWMATFHGDSGPTTNDYRDYAEAFPNIHEAYEQFSTRVASHVGFVQRVTFNEDGEPVEDATGNRVDYVSVDRDHAYMDLYFWGSDYPSFRLTCGPRGGIVREHF